MSESTTDLKIIRQKPLRFTWGPVVKIHDVGLHYTIVQYRDDLNQERVHYHIYVDGLDQRVSTRTFEGALLIAIGRRNLSENSDMLARAAAKLLDVKELI